jgi:hypothetical protein
MSMGSLINFEAFVHNLQLRNVIAKYERGPVQRECPGKALFFELLLLLRRQQLSGTHVSNPRFDATFGYQ